MPFQPQTSYSRGDVVYPLKYSWEPDGEWPSAWIVSEDLGDCVVAWCRIERASGSEVVAEVFRHAAVSAETFDRLDAVRVPERL